MIVSMGDLHAMNSRIRAVKYGLVLTAVFTMLACTNAQGRQRFEAGGSLNRDDRYPHTTDVRGWKETAKKAAPFRVHPRRVHSRAGHVRPQTTRNRAAEAAHHVAEILPHPVGCPRRAFCGCGAALKIFGRPLRELWLAVNWFRFPPAAPAPGMVAVRRHHVFVIEAVIDRYRVIAYDANSGRHQTRRHVRSLAGYSVRNPHGGRA